MIQRQGKGAAAVPPTSDFIPKDGHQRNLIGQWKTATNQVIMDSKYYQAGRQRGRSDGATDAILAQIEECQRMEP